MKKQGYLIFLVLISIILIGCATVYNPATGRNEIVVIDTDQEISLGKNIDTQIRQEFKVSGDPVLKERLDRIGQKVASVSDRQNLEYHFEVLEEKEINAFAVPGGFIYVHKATMEEATDDELACVLGHEIGHIAARHPAKKFEAYFGYQLPIAIILGQLTSGELRYVLDTFLNKIIPLGYSREDERLADRLAIKYAYKAGVDPEAMISFFNKLKVAAKERVAVPIWLSSHPDLDERIQNAQKEILELHQ